jgi:subtilisin family serine protease
MGDQCTAMGSIVRRLRASALLLMVSILAITGTVGGAAVARASSPATSRPSDARMVAATLSRVAQQSAARAPEQQADTDLISADRWRNAGFTGYGVRVAVVDFGFQGYAAALGAGLPPEVHLRSFRADSDLEAGDSHGTLAAEIVTSIAPEADLYLVNFSTVPELSDLVDYLIAEHVQVASFSIGFAHNGPGNGRGPVDDIIARATSRGMFWAVAAGNWSQQHWAGTFTDRNGNSINEFAPGVESIGREYHAEDLIIVSMRWDDPWGASCNDYDLELLGPDGSLVQASRGVQNCKGDPVEGIQVLATRDGRYRARIIRAGAQPRRIELLMLGTPDRGDAVDFPVPAGSLAEPADSAGVFTVGATVPAAPREVARFSSRGPTTDGRAKPDLLSPTGVGSGSEVAFGGTSAAAPHVAAAAALLLDALPQADARELAYQLRTRAQQLAQSTAETAGAGLLDLGTLSNVGPVLPPEAWRAGLTEITPPGAAIAVFRYRGPSQYPARFLRRLTSGRRPLAVYRLDFGRGRFDTFVTRAPGLVNTFDTLTDGDLIFVTFAR